MSKLIDADQLYDALADKLKWVLAIYGGDTYLVIGEDIRNTINDQPTAYDVDKVVGELETETTITSMDLNYLDYIDGIKQAIEIVKAGGSN